MAATLNVDAGQIVQLMLQFMRENGLRASMKALQDETGVYLNTVDDPALLKQRILAGHWDLVLQVRVGVQSMTPGHAMAPCFAHTEHAIISQPAYARASLY